MKKFTTFFALSLFVFAFNSCDAVDELTEIRVSPDLKAEVDVSIPEGSSSVNSAISLDATSNSDVRDNLGKIESVDISGFTYVFKDVEAAAGTTLSGTLSSGGQSVTLSNIAVANGTTGTVSSSEAAFLNSLGSSLKSNGKVTIDIDGSLNNDEGASFTLEITPTWTFLIDVL